MNYTPDESSGYTPPEDRWPMWKKYGSDFYVLVHENHPGIWGLVTLLTRDKHEALQSHPDKDYNAKLLLYRNNGVVETFRIWRNNKWVDPTRINMTKEERALGLGSTQCGSLFLDSGAFSLYPKAVEYGELHKCSKWKFYDTPEFWAYMDSYVEFITKYNSGIDYYANVDVITNPELSWRNQEYLESKGLKPLPVIHVNSPMKWIKKYIDRGHDFICFGGLVFAGTGNTNTRKWIDSAFDLVCDNKQRLPKAKVHGFGVTNYSLMIRYPWYSIDSTSWAKAAAFGSIYVPHMRKGQFIFNEAPYTIMMSSNNPKTLEDGKHYRTLTKDERNIIDKWLDVIEMPMGSINEDGTAKGWGVMSNYGARGIANMKFFQQLCNWLPQWPWRFELQQPIEQFNHGAL